MQPWFTVICCTFFVDALFFLAATANTYFPVRSWKVDSIPDDNANARRYMCILRRLVFGPYGTLDCHQALISDIVRMSAFRNAILLSWNKLNEKVVLDVGCGTGILSVFACQAGAAGVLVVEPIRFSSLMVSFAENSVPIKSCWCNGVSKIWSHLCPERSMTLLISEWIGYTLLSEWMLPSVISARDRFLKKGGLIFPVKCSMFIALVKEPQFLTHRADIGAIYQKGCTA